MPETPKTLADAYKGKLMSLQQLEAAVDAFMLDPTISHLVVSEGVVIDPAAAVRASDHATKHLSRADVSQRSKRDAVKSAMLLARVR